MQYINNTYLEATNDQILCPGIIQLDKTQSFFFMSSIISIKKKNLEDRASNGLSNLPRVPQLRQVSDLG